MKSRPRKNTRELMNNSINLTEVPSKYPNTVEVFNGKNLLDCLIFFSLRNQQLVLTRTLAICGYKYRLIVIFFGGGKLQFILLVNSKQKSLKQSYLPRGSPTSASVSALQFSQHHFFLQHLNFPLQIPMRFNHTCSKNLMFYFLIFKGYNFASVLPAHTTTDLIYLSNSSKISDIFVPSFSMILSLPFLLQTAKAHGPGSPATQQSLSILSWKVFHHFF